MSDYTSSSILPWGQDIETVRIEYGVTNIGNYGFSGCSSVTNVIISSSVESIGNYAFSSCSCLKTFEYYGITEPECKTNIFLSSGVTEIQVPKNYEDTNGDDIFCNSGKPVNPSL